ncbi:MAG TPA: type II secretion system protein [Cerasibacillus sp.]|uniref:PulJ/GspJ family protein n=1 Tax=Cerasibacillus sp. TaxID=2498711 RepID=UPI002F3E95F3
MQKIQKLLKTNRNVNKAEGFTLIEVTIALALLSIIAIFSFASLYYFSEYNKRVQEESEIHREANLIISSIIDDMFPVKDNELDLTKNKSVFLNNTEKEPINTRFVVQPKTKNNQSIQPAFQVGFTPEGVQLKDQMLNTTYLVTPPNTEDGEFSYIEQINSSNHYKIFLKMKGEYTAPTFTTYLRLIEEVDLKAKGEEIKK